MVIRVGAQIQPQHASYKGMRDAWLRVEEMGADTLFIWDYFFPLYGEPEGKHFECWTMLAARAWGVHAHSKNQLRYKISRSSLQPIA